jgi:hypothetical protein
LSRVGILPDYGVSNVANRATLVNFVEVDKTVTKGETVIHLNKINEVKRHLTMEMEAIEDHNLEGKVAKI